MTPTSPYMRSAALYDALNAFKDYHAAVGVLTKVIERERPGARRLLDVACGTGRHLELLAARYEVEGIDISPMMLRLARERCPDVPLHVADMANFDLGRQFDVITCLFSSIGFVKTLDRLNLTIASMRRHLLPGGLILIEPWFEPESYWTGTITAHHIDELDFKVSWMYTSEREGSVAVMENYYLVGRPSGIEMFTEKHQVGLFTRAEHHEAFSRVGLSSKLEPKGPFGRGLYLASLPGES